jgi:hypothetical protein
MACADQLGPSHRCPRAGRCEACGRGWGMEVATYQTPVGVFCATVCGPCVAAGNPPRIRSWGQACQRVGAHCEHLGLDLDQMADLLEAERRGRQ